VIAFSRRARKQLVELNRHFEERERPDAIRNLIAALRSALIAIEQDPDAGLPAPRPYPQLARQGTVWVKAGRYWIGYRRRPKLTIVAIFYETANIPGRLGST